MAVLVARQARAHWVYSGAWATAEQVVSLLQPARVRVRVRVLELAAVVVVVEAVAATGPRGRPLSVSSVGWVQHLGLWARSCVAS